MKNGAVVKPHPSHTRITDFSVNVGQSESELKQIDLNELIELVADEQTPPKFWQELVVNYNRTHLVTNTKVADNLEQAADLVWDIKKDAESIEGNLTNINNTGGVVAGALPLLYSMAEGIVSGATFNAEEAHAERLPAKPAMGTRRSRLMHAVGVNID